MAKVKSKWDKRQLYVMFYYDNNSVSPYNNTNNEKINVIDFFGYGNYSSAYRHYAQVKLPSIPEDARIHTQTYRDFKMYHPYFFIKD